MAYRDDAGKEPYRQHAIPERVLHHQVSSLTNDSDVETAPYNSAKGGPHLRARESLVSIASTTNPHDPEQGGHTHAPTSSWAGSFGYNGGGAYTPVSATADAPARRTSRLGRFTSYKSSMRHSIPERVDEEGYDMPLLSQAAPMETTPQHKAVAEEEMIAPGFDLTATLGPATAQDDDFIKALQRQEARGSLTGGLGMGLKPDSRVRDADLLLSPFDVNRSLSGSFGRAKSKRLSRAETIRHMGQDEANRRGEVIEVILEEPAGADLSTVEGYSGMPFDAVSRSTFPVKKQKTEVFYPQPNWKPITMRWPYLSLLIILSVALAAMQEILYRKYRHDPILKFNTPEDVDPGLYVIIKFLPTLCAVVYGVLWQFTDFEVRRLEAYYQLSKEGGARASESINVDYVTSFTIFRPFRALKRGHYAVAISSAATTFAVSLVPTFAAASIVLTPDRRERIEHPDEAKEIYFAAIWSHLLTMTLSICAVAGCGLFYLLQTRRSGLLADVRGIAGLAAMAVVSHILMDFKDMDTAKHRDIHERLRHHRYTLRNSSLVPDDENKNMSRDRATSAHEEEFHLDENPHPLMLRPGGSISYIVGLLLFAAFIPVFLFTPANVVTNKAPWVVTALAVILKLCWNGLDTAVRMMEPYYILWKRHAPSKTLTLDYTALPFGWMPLRALLNGHLLVFLVGFGTVMAEFLTIMVTSLATVEGQDFIVSYSKKDNEDDDKHAHSGDASRLINSGQETVASFYASLGVVLFVLLYMMAVATIVFLRRRHPFLPRQPNTIASVLAFIHQSKMLYNFVGTAKLSHAEMVKKLEDGRTYGLGWFEGRDGQIHCGVDQEELYSDYKHGVKASDGNKPWNQQWDVL